MAIERVVYWSESAQGWYDVETDVRISNLTPRDVSKPDVKKSFVTYEEVQQMIDEAFERRIAGGSNLHYFADPLDDNLIVPYSFWRSLLRKVEELDRRQTTVQYRQP